MAAATEASIAVRPVRRGGELRFEVSDDGRGFDPLARPAGSGLQNIADRMESLGGSVEVQSAPGEGTTIAGRPAAARRLRTTTRSAWPMHPRGRVTEAGGCGITWDG